MNTNATLSELATAHPAASRVFQRYGLDYCCGGRRPLAEACRARGLDAAQIVDAIQQEDDVVNLPRWDRATLPALIDFIVNHYHARLREELPALIALADRVETRHADKTGCPHGLGDHLRDVHRSVLDHLAKEEGVLFPMILSGHGSRAAMPVRVMEHEHDSHGRDLARIRALTSNLTQPAEACTKWRALYLRLAAFEAELMDHIHLENHVLFPRALAEAPEGAYEGEHR